MPLPDLAPRRRVRGGKSAMTWMRRWKASSMFWRRLVARITDARVLLDALEQVVDLEVGPAVTGLLDLAALAEHGVGLVEEQHAVGALGVGEEAAEVLLGLADPLAHDRGRDRPCRDRSACSLASTSAASVLPVPEPPTNSAMTPRPSRMWGRAPSRRGRACGCGCACAARGARACWPAAARDRARASGCRAARAAAQRRRAASTTADGTRRTDRRARPT